MKEIRFALIIIVLFALSSCAGDMQSIDLSHITFDGVSVGDSFCQIDTGKYTVSTRYPEADNAYNYEEWRITVDGGIIPKNGDNSAFWSNPNISQRQGGL